MFQHILSPTADPVMRTCSIGRVVDPLFQTLQLPAKSTLSEGQQRQNRISLKHCPFVAIVTDSRTSLCLGRCHLVTLSGDRCHLVTLSGDRCHLVTLPETVVTVKAKATDSGGEFWGKSLVNSHVWFRLGPRSTQTSLTLFLSGINLIYIQRQINVDFFPDMI